MPGPEGRPAGLIDSARRIADSCLALIQGRLQLLALELASEKLRRFDMLLKLAIALGFAMAGLLLGTLTLAWWLWNVARYAGLVIATALLLGVGVFLLWRLRLSLNQEPMPFEKTINEFKKDRACFTESD